MRTPHLTGCVITTVIAVAPITIMSATITDVSVPIPTRNHGVVEAAAITAWQPNLFQTLNQIQKLGVTSVDVFIPKDVGNAGTTDAIVIADGVNPNAARAGAAAAQQPMAAAAQVAPNPYQAQIDAIMKQLAEMLAKWMPPKPPGGGVTPPPPTPPIIPADAKKLFTGDFNTGTLDQWAMLQATGVNGPPPANYCTYSVCIRNGGVGHETAARFEVRDGDVPPFGGGERAEVSAAPWDADSKAATVQEGDERWYQFSLKFDDTWQNPRHGPSSWFVVAQWLSENPVSDGPRLTLDVTQDNYLELGGGAEAVPYRQKIAPVRPGQWEDYVVHVKFSSDPTVGFVEVYQNGKLVVPKHYRPTLAADSGGARLKVGVYRDADSSGTQVVWHDGWTVYEGATPPPSVALAARSAGGATESDAATAEVATTEQAADQQATDQEAPAAVSEPAPVAETTTTGSDEGVQAAGAKESDGSKKARNSNTTGAARRGSTGATSVGKLSQHARGVSAAGTKDKDDAGNANESKPDNDSAGAAG